jgi:hypothetical protein
MPKAVFLYLHQSTMTTCQNFKRKNFAFDLVYVSGFVGWNIGVLQWVWWPTLMLCSAMADLLRQQRWMYQWFSMTLVSIKCPVQPLYNHPILTGNAVYAGSHIQVHMKSQPRRPPSTSSPPREPQIFNVFTKHKKMCHKTMPHNGNLEA